MGQKLYCIGVESCSLSTRPASCDHSKKDGDGCRRCTHSDGPCPTQKFRESLAKEFSDATTNRSQNKTQ